VIGDILEIKDNAMQNVMQGMTVTLVYFGILLVTKRPWATATVMGTHVPQKMIQSGRVV